MIQRSYRNLLLALNHGFCQDNNNSGKDKKRYFKPKKAENQTQILKDQTQPTEVNKQPKFKKPQGLNSQARVRVAEQRAHSMKEKNNERSDRKKQQPAARVERFQWEKNHLSQTKVSRQVQLEKIKKSFDSAQQRSIIEKELQNQFASINSKTHHTSIISKIQIYLQQDFTKGKQFVIGNISKASLASEDGKQLVSILIQKILRRHIQEEDVKGMKNSSMQIQGAIKQKQKNVGIMKEPKLIPLIEATLDFAQTPDKYQAVASLLRLGEFDSAAKQKSNLVIKSLIQKFLCECQNLPTSARPELLNSFESMLQIISKKRLLPDRYILSDSMFELMDKLYFHKSTKSNYQGLFNLIASTKATTLNEDRYLEDFYQKFLATVENSQLRTTDCQNVPLPVNEPLLKKYHQFLANSSKEKESLLAILAICFSNRYLSVPQHFLQAVSKMNKSWIPHNLLTYLNQTYDLTKLSHLVKDGKKNTQSASYLIAQLEEKKRPFMNLKVAITTKDFEKAMKIFHDDFFKKLCLQKQSQVIKHALKKFYSGSEQKQRQVYQKLERFVQSLSDEYLWQSWKKSEDLGYLLEDYYIKDEDAPESKAQKRFSFWDSYFQTKRARQINRMQKLNELAGLKEPHKEPLLDTKFNLNKYLQGQSYKRYRVVADYSDKKEQQLDHYINKVELLLNDLKTSQQEVDKSKVVGYQAELCEENLQILQHFGIKDYDIQVYEVEELQNRIANFKKYQGVPKLNTTSQKIFYSQDRFDFLIQKEKRYAAFKEKMNRTPTGTSGQDKVVEQIDPTQEQTAVEEKTEQKVVDAQENEIKASNQQLQEGTAQEAQPQQESAQGAVAAETVALVKSHISNFDIRKIETDQEHMLDSLSKEFLDILRVKRRELFSEAAMNTKMKPSTFVNDLIRWGLLNREPMAIYMGEKIAMVTGQTIPHQLAIRVSDLLSYYREIDEALMKECKICLTHIGRIEREVIYNSNYHYQHIQHRPRFAHSIVHFNRQLSNRLEDLVMENPNTMQWSVEPRQAHRKLAKGSLL